MYESNLCKFVSFVKNKNKNNIKKLKMWNSQSMIINLLFFVLKDRRYQDLIKKTVKKDKKGPNTNNNRQ
jgi:hypothetical protein